MARKARLNLTVSPSAQQVMAGSAANADSTLALLEGVDIETADLEQLADIARDAHASVRAFEGEALRAALVAGRALLAARAHFSYDRATGGFRGWLERIGLPRRTAYDYIALAQYPDKVCEVRTLSEAYAAIAAARQAERLQGSDDEPGPFVQTRTTLSLSTEADGILRAIAHQRNCTPSLLITELVEAWAKRQGRRLTIDVTPDL